MILFIVGISWFIDWLLQEVFNLVDLKAALATAIIFMLLGVLYVVPWDRVRTLR